MMELNTAWQFGAALGLGMLLGMERERTRGEERTFAGVRTFSLVALLGATSVYAGEQSGLPWIVGLVFLALVALVVAAYHVTARNGAIGATTEVSILITFFPNASNYQCQSCHGANDDCINHWSQHSH